MVGFFGGVPQQDPEHHPRIEPVKQQAIVV